VRCRGEGLIEGQWQAVDDWSIEDTKTMGRPVIAKAMEFIASEQEQEASEANASKKSAPEDEGSLAERLEKQAKAFLKGLVKWDDIHFRLNASDFRDGRWEANNFGKQRVKDVVTALKWLERHDITKYNINSISTAKLGTVVVGALGGKKARVSVDDFLPFDTKKIKKENGLSDESLAVLKRLMRSRRMDGRVIALLADELKTASSREQSSE
jgi:hypothetical protein